MRLVIVRRICQAFFLLLLTGSCLVTTVGDRWLQLRGWPVSWLLELDPLVGLATVLTTGRLYKGLLWGAAILAATALLGRFFCGWLCPLGTLQQMVGAWADKRRGRRARAAGRQSHPGRRIKYLLLIGLLTMAAAELARPFVTIASAGGWIPPGAAILAGLALIRWGRARRENRSWTVSAGRTMAGAGCLVLVLGVMFPGHRLLTAGLQTGLLDPIPLVYRSVSLAALPLLSPGAGAIVVTGGLLTGGVFVLVLALSAWRPRFYCRYICPLGALLGITAKWSLWRMGRRDTGGDECVGCGRCDHHCEGACAPADQIRWAECVLCYNCRDDCPERILGYAALPSTTGEIAGPDLNRRAVIAAGACGALLLPLARLGDPLGVGWRPDLVRPPGALTESEFLKRCVKCGQCVRVCPTRVIQPAMFEAGVEGLWTPCLDFRLGLSGCRHNCIACGHVCPTAAIRPLELDERMGRGRFAEAGPIRIGTAFMDRGRCLPWAMGTPCIVCQENCPVSPKAITTRTVLEPVAGLDRLTVSHVRSRSIHLNLPPTRRPLAGGDYFLVGPAGPKNALRIVGHQADQIELEGAPDVAGLRKDASAAAHVRLQQPFVDPHRCVGCGACQHECPARGRAAIRVTAENETRSRDHALLAGAGIS
ncbi:4Fe-4S binding domain-containing protein [Candidatus Desulfarcum epimagneticum]|uniref:4Fe-4S binding domain-containing protein n=1 Tax=uncultured Desulfobacteraceae bacterium TaxID=218296 RepID=A0A484HJ95_9BACT|nr:4Fe-4S binding domain-containing protein [uncultured Desulfobacteraceae bacterium]